MVFLFQKKCAVRGCPNAAGVYGLCRLHYRRAWRLMKKNPECRRLAYRHPAIIRAIRDPQNTQKPTYSLLKKPRQLKSCCAGK